MPKPDFMKHDIFANRIITNSKRRKDPVQKARKILKEGTITKNRINKKQCDRNENVENVDPKLNTPSSSDFSKL